MTIAANLAGIHERMASAAKRAGRTRGEIALMAVCKTMPAERIREAYGAGQRLFGENRVQEFAEKRPWLTGMTGAQFHLIGHLQSNKAAKAVELFHAVDSVDSLRLADKLDAAARKLGRRLPVLIEVNIGGEAAKSGLAPDDLELEELLHDAPRLEALEIRGLMTVPPYTEDPEGARPYFRRMRELRDATAKRKLPYVKMDELSMGMSHDFEVAIEEGSTCVRIGTAIFGARPQAGAEE
ncbi:MAG: YggS family pyridoxal phosphate-dependent enzyme [Acidobacteriales bacterium]|nr:YggS family pyridoxal phosphate-dependent enzyme [Terriglobales bacterium]